MIAQEQATKTSIAVDSVQFVKELYPRLREDDAAIERYRAAIERLPPIVTARGRVLVDGFHRWQAHRREGLTEITAIDLGNLSDAEILRESIQRNAAHGQQLSAKDKERLAGQLWQRLAHLDNGERVRDIAGLLSVSERSVQGWTKDARALEKADKQAIAWDLWLECLTEQRISTALEIPRQTISDWLAEKRKSADFGKHPDSLQHFDVWQFQRAEGDSSYFGKMPPQVVENLLWLYTEPEQIVFDPFAGGGTTIEVAKTMGRRVWASDLTPSTPTLPIHKHDILAGWPESAPARADFILLDPPYWKQAAGRYSDDPADLGNMKLEDFMAAWERTIGVCLQHLNRGGRLAFVVSPSVDDDRVVDHALDMYAVCRDAGLKQLRRIIVPYNTQQATGQQVIWAREKRELLKLYRDLVVMVW